MSVYNLAISCLTTSDLTWVMDPTFQVLMQLFSLQQQTLLLPPDIYNWAPFLLWPSYFILSGAISNCPLLFPRSILDGWPGVLIFWCPIFLPFHTVHGVLQARVLEWFAISFSSGPHSVRPLHHDPSVLGGPTRHGQFHWVRRGHGLCDQIGWLSVIVFQSVCPMHP